VRSRAERQLFAPRPRARGKITSDKANGLWLADLIDFSATASPAGSSYIMVIQDVFTRKVWVKTLMDKQPRLVARAYAEIARAHGPPATLRTDRGGEWTGAAFQTEVSERTAHTIKINKNGLATLDRAIAEIKKGITRAMASDGGRLGGLRDESGAGL